MGNTRFVILVVFTVLSSFSCAKLKSIDDCSQLPPHTPKDINDIAPNVRTILASGILELTLSLEFSGVHCRILRS